MIIIVIIWVKRIAIELCEENSLLEHETAGFMWARERYRTSPPCFMVECHMRRL